ncbi:conjugal transfer protein TraB [Tsuneonella sp. HG094]
MANATETALERAPNDAGQAEGRRTLNTQIARRQKLLLAGIGGFVLIGGSWIVFGGEEDGGATAEGAATIDTGGLVNRNLSQREFVATYGNRLDAQGRAIKDLQETQVPRPAIEEELEALRSENAQMRSDGQTAIDAISAENAALRGELRQVRQAEPSAPAVPPPIYGPGVTPPQPQRGPQQDDALAPGPQAGGLSTLSFGEAGEAKSRPATERAPALILEASRDYLPPNSYAPARVIVGVDASTGVASQTDPLPVVLRITGPARSVLSGKRLLTTDLTGCLVNGAARGDLSAEKVYVKLARMTCAQPGGRYAVSEVTPEISSPQCDVEYERGIRARDRLVVLLNEGEFELRPIGSRDKDQYGRKLRVIMRSGRSLGDQLVSENFARTWTGRRETWC